MNDYKVSVLTIINDKMKSNSMDENSLKIISILEKKGLRMVSYNVLPHKRKIIKDKIVELCDSSETDLILVSVDKNAGKKYIVNEITESIIDKKNTLLDEKIRQHVLLNTAGKISLDGVSGMRNKTLIINIPINIKSSLGSILDSGIEELTKELAE